MTRSSAPARKVGTGTSRTSPRGGGSEESADAQGAGVLGALVDPANYLAAEQATDSTRRAEFSAEADRAKNLRTLLAEGDTKWQDTLIDLDFSERSHRTYLRCSKEHLRGPCPYEIDYVIEAKAPGVGEVVFGRIVMGTDFRADCDEYAKCVVKGNVGGQVRVPAGVTGLFGNHKAQTDNHPELSLKQFQDTLAIAEEGLEILLNQGPDGTPDWEYRLEHQRSYLILLRELMAEGGQ
ncbi:hypothetical protein [Nannocystis punicea]|uniref:Uncharacterized protein n=1 Tax=Nannocystis punicea TaxID=2995304 RepID=A0ABY7GX32_9BACT|nr:hypothetical protein [Nannocystis poenicansa]WAS91541.1 hypothetical protein O0S08_35610 [Nannocystis poenicansa]